MDQARRHVHRSLSEAPWLSGRSGRVVDRGLMADRVDRVSGQHATAPEQTSELPVGQAQLRGAEGVLTVDPAGEPVADERGVDGGVEPLVLVAVVADQRRDEARAVAVEQGDRLVDGLGDDEGDLGRALPLPLRAEVARGRQGSPPSRCDRRRRVGSSTFVANRSAGTKGSAAASTCRRRRRVRGQRRRRRAASRKRGTSSAARARGDAAHVERVAHLAVERVASRSRRTDRHRRRGRPPATRRRCRGRSPACRPAERRRRAGATAGPDPRATASDRRRSANSAQPAARRARPDEATSSLRAVRSPPAPGRRRARRSPRRCPGRRSRSASRPCSRCAPPRGVGEDVRAPLEHEADDSERGAPRPRRSTRRDRPSATLHVTAQRRALPAAQAGDHLVEHPLGELRAGSSTARPLPRGDVGRVGGADPGDHGAVREPVGEGAEERRDLLVADAAERRERARPRRPRRPSRPRARRPACAADRRCRRRRRDDHRLGRRPPARRHGHEAIATDDDRLTGSSRSSGSGLLTRPA